VYSEEKGLYEPRIGRRLGAIAHRWLSFQPSHPSTRQGPQNANEVEGAGACIGRTVLLAHARQFSFPSPERLQGI
jgi:hypothetical protein